LWSVVPCLTIYLSPPSPRFSPLLQHSLVCAPMSKYLYGTPTVPPLYIPKCSATLLVPKLSRCLPNASASPACLPQPEARIPTPGPVLASPLFQPHNSPPRFTLFQPHRVCETGGVTHPTFDPPSTFFPSAISMLGGEPPLLIPFPHGARSRTDFGLSGGARRQRFARFRLCRRPG